MKARNSRAAPRRARKRRPRAEKTASTLYAGSRLMGELVGRIGDFTARDAKGKRLGKFKTFEDARAAIYAADDRARAEARAQFKANAPSTAADEGPAMSHARLAMELVG